MEKSEKEDREVRKLLAEKFEAIEQLNLRKATIAKVHAELSRLGRSDLISSMPSAW